MLPTAQNYSAIFLRHLEINRLKITENVIPMRLASSLKKLMKSLSTSTSTPHLERMFSTHAIRRHFVSTRVPTCCSTPPAKKQRKIFKNYLVLMTNATF
ncbi:hypothetical protein L596_013500 [Steinernema carpocapsae]|uniref:Uncharacterized protein n=1 Tax=Steinernema carpocapsae TaxID=34508 RepID=A0A4U5P0H5_STECR|nr:hypothetical protein L596_013500 [Steinernema carpocapsae]